MTNPNVVVVNSTTAQTGVDAGDYKTQLIIDTNFNTFNRVSTYAAGGYSSIKAGATLRKALDAAFSPDIKPATVKVGRSKGTAVYKPLAVSSGDSFGFTITVEDGAFLNESTTAGAGDDAQDICAALKSLFDAESDITDHVALTVMGTGVDAVLHISLVSEDDDFTLTSFEGDYSLTGITTETAVATLSDIQDIDEGWSWVASTNHTPAYQSSLAAAVEAIPYKKYVTASQLPENYASWDEVSVPPVNNVVATMAYNQRGRTNVFYHHDADELFPEIRRVSQFAVLEPGRSSFQFKPLNGVPLAMIADGSRKLNTEELINLRKSYATTTVRDGGVVFVGGYDGYGNRMATGVRIESVYWTDRAAQVLKQRALTILFNTNKLGINDSDIARTIGAMQSWLTTQVSAVGSTFALDPERPFVIKYPKAKDITFNNKVAGLLDGIQIIAYSDASVGKIVTDLTVTFYDPTLEG